MKSLKTNSKSVSLVTAIITVILVLLGLPRVALADTSSSTEVVDTVDVSALPSLENVTIILPTVSIPLLALPEEPQAVYLPPQQVALDPSVSSSFLHVVKSFAGTTGSGFHPGFLRMISLHGGSCSKHLGR